MGESLRPVPDGRLLLSGSDDHSATLWNAGTMQPLRVHQTGGQVAGVAFSPDGTSYLVGDRSTLKIYPDPGRMMTDAGGDLDAAVRSTGLRIRGSTIEPEVGPPEARTQTVAASTPPAEGEISVVHSGEKPTSAAIELLQPGTEEPYSPPVTARPDKEGRASMTLPPGVETFAVRTIAHGTTTYDVGVPDFRRGADQLNLRRFDDFAPVGQANGVQVEAAKGQIVGRLHWGTGLEPGPGAPVSCATMTEESGVRVLFQAPPFGLVDRAVDRTVPGHEAFYLFNLSPGPHRVTVTAGGKSFEQIVIAHAGGASYVDISLPKERFPTNPSSSDCTPSHEPADRHR